MEYYINKHFYGNEGNETKIEILGKVGSLSKAFDFLSSEGHTDLWYGVFRNPKFGDGRAYKLSISEIPEAKPIEYLN